MATNRYEELSREVTRKLGSVLDRLRHVWDEIGLDGEQRRTRTEVVVAHLNNLLEEMVTEEEGLRDRLLKNIQKYGIDLLKLSKELDLPPYEPPESLTNVQLEKDLRKKVGSWEQERRDRLKQLSVLQKEEQHLCDIMCATPQYIVSGKVPTLQQLDAISSHIKELTSEKEHRYSVFTVTKKNILKMLDDLEQCPNTSFERELICEEDDSFLLTKENMNSLKQYCEDLESQQKDNFAQASRLRDHMETLWERIQLDQNERALFRTNTAGFKPKVIAEIKAEIARCEVLKLEKMQDVIEHTRKELIQWWDKCYTSPAERELFKPFTDEFYTEECLNSHEDEVCRLKDYYENNKDMLELVEKWQKLFKQFLDYDRKAIDPNRYFNRGCNLLKEEKARKKVQKELPKVQEEVCQKITEWEKSTGKQFLVGGTQFTLYIDNQWEDYKQQKEYEKHNRQQAKAKLMEEELKYGSRPATTTPGKKRTIGNGTTPGKTPTKRFRQENGTALPVYNTTASSVSGSSMSSVESSIRRGGVTKHRLPPHHPTVPARQMNDTTKTPTSYTPGIDRTGRTNHTSVFSPACMATRSAYKPKAFTERTNRPNTRLYHNTHLKTAQRQDHLNAPVKNSRLPFVCGGVIQPLPGRSPYHTPAKHPARLTNQSPGSHRNTSTPTPSGATTMYSSRKALADKNFASSNDTGFSQTTVSSAATAPAKGDQTTDISLDSVGMYTEFARGLNQNARPNCRSSVVPSQLKPAYF